MMRPRPFGSGVASAAAEVSVGAGCRCGWAWRPRPKARPRGVSVRGASSSPHAAAAAAAAASAVRAEPHDGVRFRPFGLPPRAGFGSDLEAGIEKAIYACRFMAFLAIAGSLAGSVLCFLKGCTFVMDAFMEYYLRGDGKVVFMLIEAIDMYLIGTVMFVFGTGLYELFISNMDIAKQSSDGSSLFGLFRLPERPKWLEIHSVSDLKTKLGHVIVMVLLVGISEKSKRVTITSCTDLFCFAASILLSSDMYLIGTVMFVFGTGLYELFISNMDIAKQSSDGSSLFGLFRLPERPKWLEIHSVSDLKTKLGHVIVMVLLVGISEKSKRVTITSCTDLFCFAASILLSSGCLYLLYKLGSTKGGSHA